MRRVLPLAVAIFLVLVPGARAGPSDPWDVSNVNRMIKVLSSPQLAPGESGEFAFNFTNPYSSPMQNISLNVSIYYYATIEESRPVDGTWGWAYPRLQVPGRCDGRECRLHTGIDPRDRLGTNLTDRYSIERITVVTSTDMPHGSVFAQSSYFIRLWLEFDFNNGTGSRHLVMPSRGYFNNTQWSTANSNQGPGCGPYNDTNRCIGSLNLTYLRVDGIIPDSSFGVKEPFPVWPFYALCVLVVLFIVLAFLFWVEENPGKYPRTERAWLGLKGRVRRVVRLPRRRRP